MIQFNLLPDVKLDFVRAQKTRRTVLVISILASLGAIGLLVLMFFVVNVVQKTHLKNLDGDIAALTSELESNEDLNKILTVQTQLNTLPGLHEKKAAVARLKDYLPQLRPIADEKAEVSYGEIIVNFTDQTIEISGKATAFKFANELADKMKFAKYTIEVDGQKVEQEDNPFSEVELTEFKVDIDGATYTIKAKFNPIIFDNTQKVALKIDKRITTRSVVGRPLFEQLPEPEEEEEANNQTLDPSVEDEESSLVPAQEIQR